MEEKKYFIINEFGELVRVTKEDYIQNSEEKQYFQIPRFQTPEQQNKRRESIDKVIEELNTEEITDGEMARITSGVNTRNDEEISNRERLDDDIKAFKTPSQQESENSKDAKIQRITQMLNNLQLSEKELIRITGEVERASETENANRNTIDKEGINNGRE